MRIIVGMAVAVLCVSSVGADPASILVRGGAAAPKVGEEHVRLVSETLTIDLYDSEAVVHADLLFRNEGPADECMMGFPQINHQRAATAAERNGYSPDLRDLEFVVDGDPFEVKLLPDASETYGGQACYDYEFEKWYVTPVPFTEGQERRVEISYRHPKGVTGNGGPDWFLYYLETGSRWKGGSVERIDVILNYGTVVERWCHHQTNYYTEGCTDDKEARRLTWTFEDYQGDPGTIRASWYPRELLVYVDGHAEPGATPARMESIGPLLDVGSRGERLGYELSGMPGTPDECTVACGDDRLSITNGKLVASLNGEPLALTRPPVGRNYAGAPAWTRWWVAGEDLKRAFGLEWDYNPETRKLVLKP
ncbi:MAG TPA: hypothetical protein QGH10_05415 [Armatimonadota bacterium]|nr:hypothetical protein [Armatimonadota bacterium]